MQWAGLGGWTLFGWGDGRLRGRRARTTHDLPSHPKLRWALFLGSVVFWGLPGRVYDLVYLGGLACKRSCATAWKQMKDRSSCSMAVW